MEKAATSTITKGGWDNMMWNEEPWDSPIDFFVILKNGQEVNFKDVIETTATYWNEFIKAHWPTQWEKQLDDIDW